MDDKKVSAIIPVYNSEEYIEKCLKSVIPQVDEVIIVNDCTPDNSMEIVDRYKNNRRIKIFNLKENKGPGYVRNFGAKKAKYPFLLYIDSDQILSEGWVEKAKKALLKDEKIAAVGGYRRTPRKTFSQKLMGLLRVRSFKSNPEWISEDATLYKKDIFLEVGGFNEKLRVGESIDLSKKMRERGYRFKKINIEVMHLGEPKKFIDLLKRQWRYGKYGKIEKIPSYKKFLRVLIFITPLGILSSIPLYFYIFRQDKELSKDLSFLIKLPFGYYLFMFTHQLSFLLNLMRLTN